MPVNMEAVIEKAFEQAFRKALEASLQAKTEVLFKKVFENGSPFAARLEEKLEQGFQRFVDEGIQWEKKRAGFQK